MNVSTECLPSAPGIEKKRKLYISRDRYGIKPVYYWFSGKTIVFASEIKAIIKHPDYEMGVDLDALNEYFTFQNIFSYNTLFKGVHMLPPANTVVVDCETKFVKHNSWWDYDFSKTKDAMSFDDAKKQTKELFEQAVTDKWFLMCLLELIFLVVWILDQ